MSARVSLLAAGRCLSVQTVLLEGLSQQLQERHYHHRQGIPCRARRPPLMREHLEPTPPSIFEQLFWEINRLQTLNTVSKEQLTAIGQLVERAATAHVYIQGQLIKALERIAEQPEQNEDFGNAMFHLWINADNKAEQLEARCTELDQEIQRAHHDNGVLLRMLATSHGEKLTGQTYH